MRSKESLKFEIELIYAVMRRLSRETLWFDLQEVEKTFPEYWRSGIHAIMFFLAKDGLVTRKYDMKHHVVIYKINA